MTNALTFRAPAQEYQHVHIAVRSSTDAARLQAETSAGCAVRFFQYVGAETTEFFSENLYLSSWALPDRVIDSVIEQVLGKGAHLIADASRTLEEVGRCDVQKGCSPIFYLHSLGLLSGANVAGGVYLDRDDADLMVQENASLILSPTYDAGRGNGIPPLRMYLDRGLQVGLGTMDNSFNPLGSVAYEAEILRLLVNGSMCGEAVTARHIEKLLTF